MSLRIAMPFSCSTHRWKTQVTLRLKSSLLTMVYAPARRWTCLASVSSAGSSWFVRKLRMGWSHDGAVTSSITNAATATRVGGLGCEMLGSAAACGAGAVPRPTTAVPEPGSEVPGLGATTEVPKPPAEVPAPPIEVPGPPAWLFKPEPAASGLGGTKMESDSGDGLIDGLRRRYRETSVGIAYRVEPIRARASAGPLSARGTWRNSHPSKYPLICWTRKW